METNKLQVLLETAKSGSINKVAEKLGYTQSGLTYVLNSLENELGIKLLHRGHSGVTLTPEGEELLPLIECIVSTTDTFAQRIARIRARNSGSIHIGTYNSAVTTLLPQAISSCTAKNPNIHFEITTGVVSLSQLMDDETLDLAICEEHIVSGNYQWEPLMEDEMCVVVRDDDPLAKETSISMDQLRDCHIIYPSINFQGVVATKLKEEGIQFGNQTSIVTADGSITLLIISREGGVSFVSRMYEPECPNNVLFIPLEPKLTRTIGVATLTNASRSKNIDNFIEQLKKHAKDCGQPSKTTPN